MYVYPYGMNNNMQQQLAQNRMEQLQQWIWMLKRLFGG